MLVGVLACAKRRVDIVSARTWTRLTLVLWWGRQRRDRRSELRGYDHAVGRGWLRAEAGGVRRGIVVEDMFERHCSAWGEGEGACRDGS